MTPCQCTCFLVAVLCLQLRLAAAADLRTAPILARHGHWSIRLTKDAMTDKKDCTALYQDRFDIQVNRDNFYLSLHGKGGVKGFQYRLDNYPPTKWQMPEGVMKQLNVANITGDAFKTLTTAKRLRLSIITVLDTSIEEDFDLTGLPEAMQTLNGAKCQ